jgi:hypothetical protein
MLNFEAIIQHLGPDAVSQLRYDAAADNLGILAMSQPGADG